MPILARLNWELRQKPEPEDIYHLIAARTTNEGIIWRKQSRFLELKSDERGQILKTAPFRGRFVQYMLILNLSINLLL